MALANIMWVDDEMESLKSQTIFLESKGYAVTSFSNGFDAIEYFKTNDVDVVLLDESMPGITGLETLQKLKEINNNIPIVLITKNETENLMDEAIGSQINDYLIKPVNPNQVLLSLKKILDNKRLISEKTTTNYQQEFRNVFMALNSNPNAEEWMDIYKKLVFWELEISKSDSPEMAEILSNQKTEANTEFFKFISRNYTNWMHPKTTIAPTMSHNLMASRILPLVDKKQPVIFLLLDNLRLDHWKVLQPIFAETFKIVEEDSFYSILPTATQYCRNAIMAGLTPLDMEKTFPVEWKTDDEEGGKNMHEELFFKALLKRLGKSDLKTSYTKVIHHQDGLNLVNNIHNLLNYDFSIIIYNFVDMLSHARTEMDMLKELASDETSYRALIKSWFENSSLLQALKKIAEKNIKLIVATDHGSKRVHTPVKVIGDKQTTTNIRYKHGRNLNYDNKDVLSFKDPREAGLPVPNVNSSYIFAKDDKFLCYPNNYNHYVNYYKDTFQHGGVSLEEMVIPFVVMQSK
jgi:CheY-like chemotaxis protein